MVSRLFQIVYLLLEYPMITAGELSKRLEVSQRTIYRDLDKLSAAGIPVYANKGKGGGISLLSDFVLDKAVLTAEEKTKILESLQALKAVGYADESQALEKLQSFFGEGQQDWIEVDFSNWDDSDGEGELFQQLKYAILHHNYVNLTYAGARQENTTRQVRPMKLCFKGQAWYLYAFCELRQDYRFFKLRRMTKIKIEEKHFEPQPIGSVIDHSYYKKMEQQTVTVQVKKEMAFRAYDEFQNLTVLENGDLSATMEIRDMEWFLSELFSYGPYIKVVKPESVRKLVQERLQEMMEVYCV